MKVCATCEHFNCGGCAIVDTFSFIQVNCIDTCKYWEWNGSTTPLNHTKEVNKQKELKNGK